jgi:2-oxo-3-hexenedioate decarboxylase/2-keto-4-pentenoate hydratase
MVNHRDSVTVGRVLGDALAQAYLARMPAPDGWREQLSSIAMAYDTQDAVVEQFCAWGKGVVAGYKVGLTSMAMQALCGIASPIFGRILTGEAYASGVVLSRDNYLHLGIESELALRLSCDIRHPLDGANEDVLRVIDSVHAAFEIVDDRGADYAHLSAAEVIAENGWNAGIVLGDGVQANAFAVLDNIHGRYFENGREVGQGSSGDVLGNPLNVVRWLARALLERGSLLRAGDIVMTGSIVATRFPVAGTKCRFVLSGLPPVMLGIAAA